MMPMEVGNLITTKGVGDIYIYIYMSLCCIYSISDPLYLPARLQYYSPFQMRQSKL